MTNSEIKEMLEELKADLISELTPAILDDVGREIDVLDEDDIVRVLDRYISSIDEDEE